MDAETLALLTRAASVPAPLWQGGRRIALKLQTSGPRPPEKVREYPELVYLCRGAVRYRIGEGGLTLTEGELLLLGQNTPLETVEPSFDALAARFLFKPEFFGDILAFLGSEQTPLREFILKILSQESPYGYLHFHVSGVLPVQNLMENLLLQLLQRPESRRAVPLYTVGLLFVHLLEESDKLTIGIRQQQTVLGVLRYIETNYVSGSLTRAAELLHCDVAWLSREIRRRTGKTWTELIQERRLQQAAWLLRHTRQKVADISVAVGYENVSYFHRLFRSRFGCAPKAYRDLREE